MERDDTIASARLSGFVTRAVMNQLSLYQLLNSSVMLSLESKQKDFFSRIVEQFRSEDQYLANKQSPSSTRNETPDRLLDSLLNGESLCFKNAVRSAIHSPGHAVEPIITPSRHRQRVSLISTTHHVIRIHRSRIRSSRGRRNLHGSDIAHRRSSNPHTLVDEWRIHY